MKSTWLSSTKSFFRPSYDWIPNHSISVNSASESADVPKLSQQFTGKILLRNEIPLDDETLQDLLTQQFFSKIPAIEQHFWGNRCRRCGNQKKWLFAAMPCARCGETHPYCRKCIEMGRVTTCEPLYFWTGPAPAWPIHQNPCAWQGELTHFQQKAAKEIQATMTQSNGKLIVWAVCGAGKTEMLFEGLTESLQGGKRVCLATPRADVVRELLPRFTAAFPDVTIGALYGGSEDKEAKSQFIIATTHQLLRFAYAFDVVIIDEIDAFPFHADPSLPFATNRAAKPNAAMIYLTATPRKQQRRLIDTKKLPAVFVPLRFHGQPLPVPKFHMCFDLKKSLNKDQPPRAFFRWLANRENPHRQLLVFVPTIALAEKFEVALREQLRETTAPAAIESVHAADPDRADKVQQFRNQKSSILITTTILERGVTFPSVDVAIIHAGHEVFDEAALVQIAGRAGRSVDDPTGEVIFYHDGKTEAMVKAVASIKKMNQRGRRF